MRVVGGCARGVIVVALLWIAGCGGDGGAQAAGNGGAAGEAGSAGAGSGGTGATAGDGGAGGMAGNAGHGGDAGNAGHGDDAGDERDASDATDAGHDAAPALLANGAQCSDGSACDSGFCVDGVCCDQACEGLCQACVESATGVDDGACDAVMAQTDPDDECATDACLVGVCDGVGACVPVTDGTVCRPALDVCDAPESCAAGVCPSDQVITAGTVCRDARGDCDLAEACNGSAIDCPADTLLPSQTVCREAQGVCDAPEVCDGVADACPSDALIAPGVACRPAAGVCDVAEVCTGFEAECPADARVPQGATCRMSQGACDLAEACDGSSVACPSDAKSTQICRGLAGTCDVAEICDGVNNACPSDQFQNSQSDACGVQHCTGMSAMCVACRNDNDCGQGERCTSNNACVVPKIVFSTSTTQNGNLGGLAGGDAICQTRADAAGLPGTYKAWLSTSTVSAASRLTHATVPYYMPDGVKVADDWNDLTDGTLDRGITVNELGVSMPNNRPYTGTNANGSIGGGMCNNWSTSSNGVTALMGQSFSTVSGWSATIYLACDTLARLVCFQQ